MPQGAYLDEVSLNVMKRNLHGDMKGAVLPGVKGRLLGFHRRDMGEVGALLHRREHFLVICELLVLTKVVILQRRWKELQVKPHFLVRY